MTLSELANRFGTDKGTVLAAGHGYTLVYDLLFAQMRGQVTDLCEVGLSRGGPEVAGGAALRDVADVPSVRMWREFFPGVRILGVDISDCSQFGNEWFDFVQADCGEPADLDRVAALGRQFDIIVDDGSHASYHQQLTMLKLFPLLKPSGFYVIEDLDWQPETYEASLPGVPRTDILLERFVRSRSFGDTGSLGADDWARIAEQIDAVYLFDADWLDSHRRQVNVRAGAKPEVETPIDRRDRGGQSLKSLAGQAFRQVRSVAQGPENRQRFPAVKLAVVRKIADP